MQKRYQVNVGVAAAFAQGGTFRFKIGYSVPGGIRSQLNAPVIAVETAPPQIIGVDNDHAQQCIEHFNAPRNTTRGGVQRPAGLLFTDVTGSTVPGDVDVDLDPIFQAHEQA